MQPETAQRPQPTAEEMAAALKTLQDAGLRITADGNVETPPPAESEEKPPSTGKQIAKAFFHTCITAPVVFIAFFVFVAWITHPARGW